MRALLPVLLIPLMAQQPRPVKITVRVVDVQAEKGGRLRFGLHEAPARGFPGPSTTQNQDVAAVGVETQVVFDALPGTYAIALHHDENANGKMDGNAIGIPKEGYAVSRDVRPRFRAPRFDEAKVAVSHDTTITIRMRY
jgi:uncharacterized protein (DUF2141 family)